jgi:transcriptional regulator of acetoin/glycerol metabolism
MSVIRQAARAKTWTRSLVLPSTRQAARAEVIARSHLRCAALGLSRDQGPDFKPLLHSTSSVARERNQRLLVHAVPVMEMLYEQIVDTESMIALTDAQGTILNSVGDNEFLDRAAKVALSVGANWAEQSKGTNAIGTALFEEAPTLVHGEEHFMHANSFLTSSATPIFDPGGNILGVLDVSGDQRRYHQHTMALVRVSARMIENHWLCDERDDQLRLHFHARADFIGTLLEGIIVVETDGKVIGANRSALDQLDLSSSALRMHSLASLFSTAASAVIDHFRVPRAEPMRLRLPDGRILHASARFNGRMRPRTVGAPTCETELASDLAGDIVLPHVRPLPSPSEQASSPSSLQDLKTGDAQVETVLHKVRRVLNRDIPLLILGETGTGKELLARAVHNDSNRARHAFIAVNCACIPESLIEAELFGYEDGAFTGARRKGAVGRIVQAHGGTLFLDEVGDMPPQLQARLLRVLQERCVTPLGSQKSIPVDIAVIGATHRNLRDMIAVGTFREDLYYRLNGLVVRLPSLRERTDLCAVARRILLSECVRPTPHISPSVMALFNRYAWPGNIRQLANVLRTAAVMAAGEPRIDERHLSDDFLEDAQRMQDVADRTASVADAHELAAPASMKTSVAVDAPVVPEALPVESLRTLGEAEIEMIRGALAAARGNISAASKRLGISRNTIYRKLVWPKAA